MYIVYIGTVSEHQQQEETGTSQLKFVLSSLYNNRNGKIKLKPLCSFPGAEERIGGYVAYLLYAACVRTKCHQRPRRLLATILLRGVTGCRRRRRRREVR